MSDTFERREAIPAYLLEKVARHGHAVERLRAERRSGDGELGLGEEIHAIAFDAADYVWAFLAASGYEEAQTARYLRNHLAEQIAEFLQSQPWLRDAGSRE